MSYVPVRGLLFGVVVLLSACGGGAAPASAPASAAPPPASPSAPASAKPASASAPASAKPGASAAAGDQAAAKPSAPAATTASARPALGKVTMAITDTPTVWPAYVAAEGGLFAKYGIDFTLLNVQGAPVALAGLTNGDVQISSFAGTIVDADPGGKDLAFIGASKTEYDQFTMWTKPSIKDVKSLTGLTFGGSTPGAAVTLAARAVFKANGMDPDKDVKWTFLQNTAAQLAGLSTGQVDGTLLSWPTYIEARKQGFNMVADLKPMHIPAASSTYSINRAWWRDHPDQVQAYLKGMIEGIAILNSDKARAEQVLAKRFKITDQTLLDEAYARYAPYANPPYMTPEAVAEAIQDSPNDGARGRQPGDYLLNAPLDAIVKSGFVDEVKKATAK
jgi:ABC-type nitrate/sulfonate/bicarbonate transport system substrate-binding protein